MGVTSENVTHHFVVTREEQDHAAIESHKKAAVATAVVNSKMKLSL